MSLNLFSLRTEISVQISKIVKGKIFLKWKNSINEKRKQKNFNVHCISLNFKVEKFLNFTKLQDKKFRANKECNQIRLYWIRLNFWCYQLVSALLTWNERTKKTIHCFQKVTKIASLLKLQKNYLKKWLCSDTVELQCVPAYVLSNCNSHWTFCHIPYI